MVAKSLPIAAIEELAVNPPPQLGDGHQEIGQGIRRHDDQSQPPAGLVENLIGHPIGIHDSDWVEIRSERT